MKERLKVAICQIAIESLDADHNLETIQKAFEDACAEEARPDLVVFPELSNTGYVVQRSGAFGSQLNKLAEQIPQGRTSVLISRLCQEYRVYCVCGICEADETIPAMLYNTAVLFDDQGRYVGKHRKMYIPGEEKHYFRAGDRIEVFETALGKVALQVCYDMWYPELSRIQALMGAELIVSVWNVAESMAPWTVFYGFIGSRALENRCFSIGCNRVGTHGSSVFKGNSMAVDPNGRIQNPLLQEPGVVRAELHAKTLLEARGVQPTLTDGRYDLIQRLCQLGERAYAFKAP